MKKYAYIWYNYGRRISHENQIMRTMSDAVGG
jgi:hypothetical protein